MTNHQEKITKASQLIEMNDGSEIKITATLMFSAGLEEFIDFFTLHRNSKTEQWRLLSKQPHKDSKTMSVDEYIKKGRPEYLNYVSHGQVLKVISLLNQPLLNE
tara:strand:- start:260 stop:571 length:312 start_codon:yes stop_codon:yes gene_type:complete